MSLWTYNKHCFAKSHMLGASECFSSWFLTYKVLLYFSFATLMNWKSLKWLWCGSLKKIPIVGIIYKIESRCTLCMYEIPFLCSKWKEKYDFLYYCYFIDATNYILSWGKRPTPLAFCPRHGVKGPFATLYEIHIIPLTKLQEMNIVFRIDSSLTRLSNKICFRSLDIIL